MSRRSEPRIWPTSESVHAWADQIDDYFHLSGPFAEIVQAGRWNDRRARQWEIQYVEKLRKYAAWLDSQETAAASRRNQATAIAAESKLQRRAFEFQKLEALRAKLGSLERAIRRHLRTTDQDLIAACKARYYREKKLLRSARNVME
jgi:hypothetical protein